MEIKPIETVYQGYKFRSRLEARWGVFFTELGIKWEYEKEGYILPDGTWYLPDFWIQEWGSWVEIKPDYPTDLEIEKCRRLADATNKECIMIWGQPWATSREKDGETSCEYSYRAMFSRSDDILAREHFIFSECRRCPAIAVLYVGDGRGLCTPERSKEMKPFVLRQFFLPPSNHRFAAF